MGDNNWGEIKDSSRKNNKGFERRVKESLHYSKPAKQPKRQPLHSTKEKTREKEFINKFLTSPASTDFDYDER